MTASQPSRSGESQATGRTRARAYLPPQHGAWAMLVVPWLLGTAASSWTWLGLVLLLGWLLSYLWAYYALQGLKTRRWRRVRPQLTLYGLLLVPVGLVLVVAEPWLLVAASVMLPFSAVNAWYARHRRDRALVNGLASVTQACLMVPIAYELGGGPESWQVVELTLAAWLYFAGTVPYVKTMIREKGDAAYVRASVAYHAVALVAAWLLAPWLALPFAVFLARAWVMPRLAERRRVRPAVVGVLEIVNCVLLVVVALPATG